MADSTVSSEDSVILEVRDGQDVYLRGMDPEDFVSTPHEGEYIRPRLDAEDSLRDNPRWDALHGTFRVRAVIHDLWEGQLRIIVEFGCPNSLL